MAFQLSSSQGGTQQSETPLAVVCFELPSSGVCTGCRHHVGKGTRFNAEKHQTGEKYLSTRILQFHMKCTNCCETEFVIRTNPEHRGFDYVKGIQKQGGGGKPHHKPKGRPFTSGTTSDSDEEKFALEHIETVGRGKRKAIGEFDQLVSLKQSSERCFAQDSDMNAAVRASFRSGRKDRKNRQKAAGALGFRVGASLDQSPRDAFSARLSTHGNSRTAEGKRLRDAPTNSIFSARKKSSSQSRFTGSRRKEDRQPSSSTMPATDEPIPDGIVSSSSDLHPAMPDGIVSSNSEIPVQPTSQQVKSEATTSLPMQLNTCTRAETQSTVKKKKRIVIGLKNQTVRLIPREAAKSEAAPPDKKFSSALEAIADYGSDSS